MNVFFLSEYESRTVFSQLQNNQYVDVNYRREIRYNFMHPSYILNFNCDNMTILILITFLILNFVST